MNLKEYSQLALRTDALANEPTPIIRDGEVLLALLSDMKSRPARDEYEASQMKDGCWQINVQRFNHSILGLASEWAELMEGDNYVEEIGDMFWYLNVAFDSLGASIDQDDDEISAGLDCLEDIGIQNGILADRCKRFIFYKEDPDKVAKNSDSTCRELALFACQKIKANLFQLLIDNDIELDEILEKNIAKLEVRYPKLRFCSKDAIDRDVKKEQQAF